MGMMSRLFDGFMHKVALIQIILSLISTAIIIYIISLIIVNANSINSLQLLFFQFSGILLCILLYFVFKRLREQFMWISRLFPYTSTNQRLTVAGLLLFFVILLLINYNTTIGLIQNAADNINYYVVSPIFVYNPIIGDEAKTICNKHLATHMEEVVRDIGVSDFTPTFLGSREFSTSIIARENAIKRSSVPILDLCPQYENTNHVLLVWGKLNFKAPVRVFGKRVESVIITTMCDSNGAEIKTGCDSRADIS